MNRGIARRTVFEDDKDYRFFLSLLAREVRAGHIEVHAFSVMMTHYHVLVRSLTGKLSEVMRRVQSKYSRRFNRTRKRDGPLYRGRFLSRPVESLGYRRNVVTYVHDNAVAAGRVADPLEYEWGSAFYLAREKRPRWLATTWVDDELGRRGAGDSLRERLASAFPSRVDPEFRGWVERQLSQRLPDELADVTLKHAGSKRVVRWAFRKAELADGTRPFRPPCTAHDVDRVLREAQLAHGPMLGLFRRHSKDAWPALRAGILRRLAAITHREIGMRTDRHSATVCRDIRDHERLVRSERAYATFAAALGHRALAATK